MKLLVLIKDFNVLASSTYGNSFLARITACVTDFIQHKISFGEILLLISMKFPSLSLNTFQIM